MGRRTVVYGQYKRLYGVRTGLRTAFISHRKVQEIQGNPCEVGMRLALAGGASGPALLGGGADGRRHYCGRLLCRYVIIPIPRVGCQQKPHIKFIIFDAPSIPLISQ